MCVRGLQGIDKGWSATRGRGRWLVCMVISGPVVGWGDRAGRYLALDGIDIELRAIGQHPGGTAEQ